MCEQSLTFSGAPPKFREGDQHLQTVAASLVGTKYSDMSKAELAIAAYLIHEGICTWRDGGNYR